MTNKLLFIYIYLSHENHDANVDEFIFQLTIVNNIIQLHQDCEIVLRGDFNVDFKRNWSHTNLSNVFVGSNKRECCNGNMFVGDLAYAADIALLASTTRAMRFMLGISDDFAQEFAIVSTLKSQNVSTFCS